jgi:hypothetical protein
MSRPLIAYSSSSPITVRIDYHDYFINSDDTCQVTLPNPNTAPIGYEVTIYGSDNTQQGDCNVKCDQDLNTDFRNAGFEADHIGIPSLSSATFKNMGMCWAVVG